SPSDSHRRVLDCSTSSRRAAASVVSSLTSSSQDVSARANASSNSLTRERRRSATSFALFLSLVLSSRVASQRLRCTTDALFPLLSRRNPSISSSVYGFTVSIYPSTFLRPHRRRSDLSD